MAIDCQAVADEEIRCLQSIESLLIELLKHEMNNEKLLRELALNINGEVPADLED